MIFKGDIDDGSGHATDLSGARIDSIYLRRQIDLHMFVTFFAPIAITAM